MRYLMLFLLLQVCLACLPGQAHSQFPSVIDLSQTSADVTILGATDANKAGYALASGDLNGDGLVDLVVASPTASPLGRLYAGEVDIIWGISDFDTLIDLGSFQGSTTILGKGGEKAVNVTLNCGDYNKDGYDDLVIGMPLHPFPFGDGKAYIIFGATTFPDTVDLQNTGMNVTSILGPYRGWMGRTMTTGDVNGDTYDDLVIAAPAVPSNGGEVYVIHGRDSFPGSIAVSTASTAFTRIIDPQPHQATGKGLSCEDVNGDGYDDLLIGSPGSAQGFYQGKGTLLYGSASLPDTIFLSDSSLGMKRVYPEYTHGQLGSRVVIADVNGDSYQDLILAAPGADPFGCSNCGEIYVIHGSSDAFPDSIPVNSASIPITRLIGAGNSQLFGVELICADLNGDGRDDVIVASAPDIYVPTDVPKVTVVYGESSFPDSVYLTSDTTVTRIYGESYDGDLGLALNGAGYNSDSRMDLVVGARYEDPLGRSNAGKAYLFYGHNIASGIRTSLPVNVVLLRNYPNPFSSTTVFEYELRKPTPVTVTIYNIRGQRVAQIRQPFRAAGRQMITWDGTDDDGRKVASGIYLYRLQAGGFSQTKKIVVLR